MRIVYSLLLIASVLCVVQSCSKKTSAPTASKMPAVDSKMVFTNFCARCHGSEGTNGKAPNLALAKGTHDELVSTITNGYGHMPGFADKLSKAEITAVADFVASLRK